MLTSLPLPPIYPSSKDVSTRSLHRKTEDFQVTTTDYTLEDTEWQYEVPQHVGQVVNQLGIGFLGAQVNMLFEP